MFEERDVPTKGKRVKCEQCDQEFVNVEAQEKTRQERGRMQCMEVIALSAYNARNREMVECKDCDQKW